MRPILGILILCLTLAPIGAGARDDGRFAGSPLKAWFDRLASGKGLCCSFADGVSVQDVDWDTMGRTCAPPADKPDSTTLTCAAAYRVRLEGQWVVVPDAAVVTEPNKFGPAVVWPYKDNDGATQIRCFMPGTGA